MAFLWIFSGPLPFLEVYRAKPPENGRNLQEILNTFPATNFTETDFPDLDNQNYNTSPIQNIENFYRTNRKNKGNKTPKSPKTKPKNEMECPVITPTKQNRINVNCDPGPVTSGHICQVTCRSGKVDLLPYFELGAGEHRLAKYVELKGVATLVLTCQNDGNWDVNHDIATLKCIQRVEEKQIELTPSKKRKKQKTPSLVLLETTSLPPETVPAAPSVVFEQFPNLDLEDLARAKTQYVNPDPSDYIGDVNCPMQKKIPKNGQLICPNSVPSTSGDISAVAGDICKIRCERGWASNSYTELQCIALKNVQTQEIEGVWSQKRAAECLEKTDDFTTLKPKTETTLYSPPPTQPTTTEYREKTGAFFPTDWKETQIPEGYINLNKPLTEAEDIDNVQRYTQRNIILPIGQCIECIEARDLKQCLRQKKVCNLKKSEVCFAEIRKNGNGMMISRGCKRRDHCLQQYHNHILFDPARGDHLIANNQFRPEQQCRHLGIALAQGNSQVDHNRFNDDQKCVSCHKVSMSVPFF